MAQVARGRTDKPVLRIMGALCALAIIVVGLGQACGPAFSPMLSSESLSSASSSLTESEKSECVPVGAQAIAPSALDSISKITQYINSLKRPVRIHCVVLGLPRPLRVQLGVSARSAQPSPGPSDPRIFIQSGGAILGFVAAGAGQNLLEVGAQTSISLSEKAEFSFPVTDPVITESAGLDHIRFGSGTTCGLCHTGESLSRTLGSSSAFQSSRLQFATGERVGVGFLRNQADECIRKQDKTDRCLLYRSLVDGGDPISFEF